MGKSITELILLSAYKDISKSTRYTCDKISKYFKPSSFQALSSIGRNPIFYWGDKPFMDFDYRLEVDGEKIEIHKGYSEIHIWNCHMVSAKDEDDFDDWLLYTFPDIYQTTKPVGPEVIKLSIKRRI